MKKLLFGLLATIMLGFVGNAQDFTRENVICSIEDYNDVNYYRENNIDFTNTVRPKNGWYYAGVDAGGAYAGFQAGASTGIPLAMAAGLVWGGVCSSAWSYYWDNRTISPITNPKGLTLKYVDDYDKTGFLHNKYLVDFINNHNKEYSSEIEFLDEFYPIVSEQICKDYSLSIQDFNKINPRNLMLDKLILISNSYSDDNVVLVNNLSNNLLITSGSKILTEKFKKIMSEVTKYDISNYIVIDNIIEKEILNVKTDTTINKTEKEVVLHSINLLKYSYKLWSIN